MRKLALLFLFCLPLVAGFFPSTVTTKVKSVKGSDIILASAFPVTGMSGIVIHAYADNLSAITSRITQTDTSGKATLLHADIIPHEELPTVKTPVKAGDKVIGGYLYDNVLLLAPDADTYAKITKTYHKTWIHPDTFALYLSVEGEEKPTRQNLQEFAKKYQIGLVYMVRQHDDILLDPISGKIVAQKARSHAPATAQFPFYMRFEKLESGWFGSEAKGDYYTTMGQF